MFFGRLEGGEGQCRRKAQEESDASAGHGRTDRRPIVFGAGEAAVRLAEGLAGESDERQGSCKASGRRDTGGQAVRVCARARACSSTQGVRALAIAVHPGRSRAAGHPREARRSAHSVAAAAPQFQAWAGCSTAGDSGAGAACGTTGAAVPKHHMLAPKGASGEPQAHCPGPGSRMGVCGKGVRGFARKHFSFQCGSRPSSHQATQYSHGGCRRWSHVICQIF